LFGVRNSESARSDTPVVRECRTLALSPAAFGRLIDDETGKWAKVIKTAGITAE
jgi:hypothetical protein